MIFKKIILVGFIIPILLGQEFDDDGLTFYKNDTELIDDDDFDKETSNFDVAIVETEN